MIPVPAEQIVRGDEFVQDGKVLWTAVSDAVVSEGSVAVDVQFLDRGISVRIRTGGPGSLSGQLRRRGPHAAAEKAR